jgi:hypothetical protein
MSLEKVVKYYKFRDLTGDEIKFATGKFPVLFSDVPSYKNLEDLLGPEKFVIILYQTSSKTNGHYVCISANDDGKIRFNEPYGLNPIEIRKYTPFDDPYGEYIVKMLEPYDVEYNTTDYQGKGGVSTCGRWATIFAKLRNVSMDRILQFFTTNQSNFLRNKDNCATILTLMSLNNIEEYLLQ